VKLILAALSFIFVWISFIADAQASLIDGGEPVRVRLSSFKEKIKLTGTGLRIQNKEEPFQIVAIPQKSEAEVRLVHKNGKSHWVVRLNNKDPERIFVDPFLLIEGQGLRAEAKALPNKIILHASSGSGGDLIGVLPLEEYLVGVLASEVPLSWPLETLKAQAVAARSYALAVMKERKNRAFHVESSILDQVFRHVLSEDDKSPLIDKALQAVRETKGLRLLTAKNQVLKAFYHSDCGGQTTTAKNVWNHGVNTGTAVDSSCPSHPGSRWKFQLSRAELLERLKVAEFKALELIKPLHEKRISAVRVAFNDMEQKVIPANEFRKLLGFQELKSAAFTVVMSGDDYIFQGEGFGHGVGLCQWGSRALGLQGRNYKQILSHYYPLAAVK